MTSLVNNIIGTYNEFKKEFTAYADVEISSAAGSTRFPLNPAECSAIQAIARKAAIRHIQDNAAALAGVGEQDCPGHVASDDDPKRCGICGVHIDAMRPDDDPL